jgi:hypothetical protein
MICRNAIFLACVAIAGSHGSVFGQEKMEASPHVVRDVQAEGSCAVVGMTAEQCQLLALQRARAAAIEQAAGVAVTSSGLVTSSALAGDFIKVYSLGYIVKEKAEWLPLTQYQRDSSMAPIPGYRVRILVDVYRPAKKIEPIGLRVSLNQSHFKGGERAEVTIRSERKAQVGIFNITADDRVTRVFPNTHDRENIVVGGDVLRYPSGGSRTELVMETLAGHQRDTEAFLVIAVAEEHPCSLLRLFPEGPQELKVFFARYTEIADYAEDTMLTYEVTAAKGE